MHTSLILLNIRQVTLFKTCHQTVHDQRFLENKLNTRKQVLFLDFPDYFASPLFLHFYVAFNGYTSPRILSRNAGPP